MDLAVLLEQLSHRDLTYRKETRIILDSFEYVREALLEFLTENNHSPYEIRVILDDFFYFDAIETCTILAYLGPVPGSEFDFGDGELVMVTEENQDAYTSALKVILTLDVLRERTTKADIKEYFSTEFGDLIGEDTVPIDFDTSELSEEQTTQLEMFHLQSTGKGKLN